MAKIGIIISTTRDARLGDKVANWVLEAAQKRGSKHQYEIVDLRDYDLPFFNEMASNAWVPTQNEAGKRWQAKLDQLDGFIFVTAEYNRGVPAPLKNAIDFAYNEWNRKPAAYVGYGSVGGSRAIEQLRLINIETQMAPMRNGVHIQGADFFGLMQGELDLNDLEYLQEGLTTMFDELEWWTDALVAAKQKETVAAE